MRILVSEKLSPHKMKTPEGYLICTDAILSRTGKQSYRRSELWGDTCTNANEEVEVDRKAEEVFSDKTLASFENKPVCIEHPDEDVDINNHNQLSVGFVRDIKRGKVDGQDVMLGTLVITDADAVEAIERGDYTELSCGYNCDIVDEDNPQQRNIRGNHVALCEHGRAGIARIVDSVDDMAKLSAEESATLKAMIEGGAGVSLYNRLSFDRPVTIHLSKEDKEVLRWHKNENQYLTNKEKTLLKKLLDESKVKDSEYHQIDMTDPWVGGTHSLIVKAFSFEEAKKKAEKFKPEWKFRAGYEASKDDVDFAKRRGLYVDSVDDAYASKRLLEKIEQQVKLNGTKSIGQLRKRLEGDMELQRMSNENIKKICKSVLNIELGDEDMKDTDFSKETKQGYKVVELYREGGRLHAIVKRSNDFVVALGYNTMTGEWGQGRYDNSTLEKARETLMKEKPYSRRIQDSVHDINYKGVEIRLFSDGYQLVYVDRYGRRISEYQHVPENEVKRAIASTKRKGENVYYFVNADIRHKLGDDDWSSVEEENYKKANEAPLKKDYDRSKETDNKFLKSTKQVFSVSYMKDGVIYINKVRANSIEDAIRKVRDNGHKVVVFTNEALHELGKNNSIGKYDRVIQAMRSLYSETLLPDDKLKEKIRQTLPRLIAKYVKE